MVLISMKQKLSFESHDIIPRVDKLIYKKKTMCLMEQKMFWFLAWVQWSIISACVIQSMTWFIWIYQLCVPIFKHHKICTVCLNGIKHERARIVSFYFVDHMISCVDFCFLFYSVGVLRPRIRHV